MITVNGLANGGAVSFTAEETKDVPASSPGNQFGNHLMMTKLLERKALNI